MFDEKMFRKKINNWQENIPEHRFIKKGVIHGNIKDIFNLISIIRSSFIKK